MAFPTSHSHPDGTANPAPTWWRGPVRVLAQTESRAKPDGERDRIRLGLVAVSTARLRSIAVETGNTRYANLRLIHSQIWASSASCPKMISPVLATRAAARRWKATFAASAGRALLNSAPSKAIHRIRQRF